MVVDDVFLLVNHGLQLVHSALVELNVLFNVNLVTVDDHSESVRDLVGKVLLLYLVHLGHQLLVQLGILLVQKAVGVVKLGQVFFQWFLVLAEIGTHVVADLL